MAKIKQSAQKNLQLADLGLNRRFEITTAEERRDPYARYNERDLEALRGSVQSHQTSKNQRENRQHLDAWSSFHETVRHTEGDLPEAPQLLNGQSHRAHLHFEMRNQEASRKPQKQITIQPVSQSKRTPYASNFSKRVDAPQHKFGRSVAVRIQRRPTRVPSSHQAVDLAEPSTWLTAVKSETKQCEEAKKDFDEAEKNSDTAEKDFDTAKKDSGTATVAQESPTGVADDVRTDPEESPTTGNTVFHWLQELGQINDALADFDFADVDQRKILIDRKNQLVTMINAASKKRRAEAAVKSDHSQATNDFTSYWQKTLPQRVRKESQTVPENVPKAVALYPRPRRK